jgi:tRNA threonylcarbamoyl adenosine modification protein YeaZ
LKYKAAIDLSSEASFAVAEIESGKIIFEKFKQMKRRDSSSLAPWMLTCLQEKNIELSNIKEWIAGTGPGSFTGMRLASSLIAGFGFDKKDVSVKGIPSALAMANALNSKPGERIAALYDGRNKELLLFGAINKNGNISPSGISAVIGAEKDQAQERLSGFDLFCAQEKDREAIEKTIPENLSGKIEYFDRLPISKLFSKKITCEDENISNLVYIRPAVFVPPLKTRSVI